MQVKLCPKCGVENKLDKASCSGCYASLEGVAPTEATEKPAPVQAQPAAQQPPAPKPISSTSHAGAGPPQSAPSYSYSPAVNERQSVPVKRGPNWGAIVFVLLLLGGAAFGGWWFFLKPASPEAMVQKFENASAARDYDGFKSCISQEDLAGIGALPGGEQTIRDSWDQAAKRPATSCDIVKTTYENSGATAVVEIRSKDQSKMPGTTTKEIVLVQEEGKWKVSVKASVMRMMKKRFPNGMPGMSR